MASHTGEAAVNVKQGVNLRSGHKDCEGGSTYGEDTGREAPSLQIRITGTEKNDHCSSPDRRKGKTRPKSGDRSAKLRLTDSASMTSEEKELWKNLENTMAAKQTQVQQVLEDFGIADVEPESDALEEQLWRVVQGEITFQEAVDLV